MFASLRGVCRLEVTGRSLPHIPPFARPCFRANLPVMQCPRGSDWVLCLGAITAILAVSCGPSVTVKPIEHTNQGQSSGDETTVVVPPADSTSKPVATDSPPPEDKTPKTASTVQIASIEPCIDTLRTMAGGPDKSKAKGLEIYQEGLDAERQNKKDQARRKYLKVLQENPDSTLVPPTYFAFGEMFRLEAVGDPSKTMLAEQSYKEVLKYPAGKGTIWGVTQYRLGQALAQKSPQEALAAFAKAAKTKQQYPNDGCADLLAWNAADASAPVFAEVGDVDKCVSFYQSITSDEGATAIACVTVAQKLAEKKKGAEAQRAIAASLLPASKAKMDATQLAAFCQRAQGAATDARASGGTNAALDKALSAACP